MNSCQLLQLVNIFNKKQNISIEKLHVFVGCTGIIEDLIFIKCETQMFISKHFFKNY